MPRHRKKRKRVAPLGYRPLVEGEVIKEGDEFYRTWLDRWVPTKMVGVKIIGRFHASLYRRPI